MLKYPALYKPSQNAQLFNVKVFWFWIVNALIHSVMLFWLPMLAYEYDIIWINGKNGGYLELGNIVYTVSEQLINFKVIMSSQWMVFSAEIGGIYHSTPDFLFNNCFLLL